MKKNQVGQAICWHKSMVVQPHFLNVHIYCFNKIIVC